MSRFLKIILPAVLLLIGANVAHAATPLVDVAWLKSNLSKPGLVVLDLRNRIGNAGSPEIFRAGHIPGAVYSDYLADGWRVTRDGVIGMLPPVSDLEKLIGGLGIGNDTHVVLVAGGVNAADMGSATRVYWTFKVLGHDAVSILDGGHAAWIAAGAAIEKGAASRSATAFAANFRSQLIATRADVLAARKAGTALIDNRPPAQYSGAAKHAKAQRAGTIPGAVNLPQGRITVDNGGFFADAGTIGKLLAAVGIKTGTPAITFCNTGHWASLGWFVEHELRGNKRTRMYDGSMVDYTSDATLPVEMGAGS
ncbi:MAG: sulfurtransferase [Alphaproteobacteria bacterium]